MSHHKFEAQAACQSCRATGVYVGMGERDGFAVQCSRCKGTGEVTLSLEWDDFNGREIRDGVERVVEHNPGIGLGVSSERGYSLESFGGMSYSDWLHGTGFPQGSEMRHFVCPAWWYQSVDYSQKPDWDECLVAGAFSDCKRFGEKSRCWERFDVERAKREES